MTGVGELDLSLPYRFKEAVHLVAIACNSEWMEIRQLGGNPLSWQPCRTGQEEPSRANSPISSASNFPFLGPPTYNFYTILRQLYGPLQAIVMSYEMIMPRLPSQRLHPMNIPTSS